MRTLVVYFLFGCLPFMVFASDPSEAVIHCGPKGILDGKYDIQIFEQSKADFEAVISAGEWSTFNSITFPLKLSVSPKLTGGCSLVFTQQSDDSVDSIWLRLSSPEGHDKILLKLDGKSIDTSDFSCQPQKDFRNRYSACPISALFEGISPR